VAEGNLKLHHFQDMCVDQISIEGAGKVDITKWWPGPFAQWTFADRMPTMM
jgi:hypothetical protein